MMWCEGEGRSIQLQVERKQSKDIRQEQLIFTLCLYFIYRYRLVYIYI